MTQLIEGGKNSDPKIVSSRRRFLYRSTIAAAAIAFGSGCTTGGRLFPWCSGNVTPEDCKLLPRLELSPDANQKAQNVMAPILRLMPTAQQSVEIYINPVFSHADTLWTDSPDSFSLQPSQDGKSLHFIMPGNKIPPQDILEKACYYGALNLFDAFAPNPIGIRMPRRTFYTNVVNQQISKIMTMGSYMEGQTSPRWGEPIGDDALFASLLTVIRFFPEEVVQRIRQITDSKARRDIVTLALDSLRILKQRSSIPVTDQELPYSPSLINNLIAT